MSFSLVQVEVDRHGNERGQCVVGADFASRDAALERARQIAEAGEKCGHNDDRGYWWFHRDETLFRLIVRASQPAPRARRAAFGARLLSLVANAIGGSWRHPGRSTSSSQGG